VTTLPPARLFLLVACAATLASCGGEPEETAAVFTSDVVQRETCRVTGDEGREVCTRENVTQRLRVTLVEDAFERVWLTGIQREGNPERTILGTRDALGGYLFEDVITQSNSESGCTRVDDLLISLRLEEDVDPARVGTDDCVALVGRETRTTTTSPECDDVNDPPQQVQRIVRRRWEPAAGCEIAE
jgi:hypothetical protein